MANMTDEDFLKDLEERYPNEDWDNLPSPESFPDIYKVSGYYRLGWKYELGETQEEDKWVFDELMAKQQNKFGTPFSIHTEFKTYEEAEKCADKWKKFPHVHPSSIEIKAYKPDEILDKHLCKELRDKIKSGQKVFPMYLP